MKKPTALIFEFALALVATNFLACSAGGDSPRGSGVSNPGGGSSGNGSSGGAGPAIGSGGSVSLGSEPGSTTTRDPNDLRDVPVRTKSCDASNVCTCLRLALIGTLASAADNADTKPFTDWLNENSGGTATVKMIANKPTIDAKFLADFDILLVANVNGWKFSEAERAAVAKWSAELGGGIVSLTGFISTQTEPADTSQLIEFSGIRYASPSSAMNGQPLPIFYKAGTVDMRKCLQWNGPGDDKAQITAPIKFAPQAGSLEKLTTNLDYVGAFIGWNVVAPADATVIASDPTMSSNNMAVAKEVAGKGRVFAFGDEWVILANQWAPKGQPYNMQKDQYNPCWNAPDAAHPDGYFHSVQTLYQTKQFWFDVINWVAPPNECSFTVKDPDVRVN